MTAVPNIVYKTRIAPTPSGFLHLGNILSFVITDALARKHNAGILLRIDDLDQLRVNKQYLQDTFDTLNFLEIPWDAGSREVKDFYDNFSQVHRMPLYAEALEKLKQSSRVYACNCSRTQIVHCTCQKQQLPLDAPGTSWRLITDHQTVYEVQDISGRVTRAALPLEMQNFVVKKKDGFPSYQLASLIDDSLYGINLIVRGQDLWHSTLAQMQLACLLGKQDFIGATFFHHPLITDALGQKLSKSAGATSVHFLRQNGKSRGDIFTMIAHQLGSAETVSNWQQLADIILPKFGLQ